MILFDISKLISSLKKSSPTGIDRVELQYFMYLVENKYEEVEFVFKFRNNMHVARKEKAVKLFNELGLGWKYKEKTKKIIKNKNTLYWYRKWLTKSNIIKSSILYQKITLLIKKRSVFDRELEKLISKSMGAVVYLNVSHANVENEKILEYFKCKNIKIVCMLHDLIPVTHPQYCTLQSTQKHHIRLKSMVKNSDIIIANSNYTKKELMNYFDHLNDSIVFIAPLGTELLPNTNCFLEKNVNHYFVTVGTIEARKNHELLLKVWKSLLMEMGGECPYLYIVGQRGWKNEQFFRDLELFKRSSDKIIEINNADDKLLTSLMKRSKGLLMPTYIEGWCMPITEALSINVPVLCTDLEVLRESSQNEAIYLPNDCHEIWVEEIKLMCSQDKVTQNSFKMITWEKHLKEVFKKIDSELIC